MVKYYGVQAVDKPKDIEVTLDKVYIVKNLKEIMNSIHENDEENSEQLVYEFDLEEYTKDEYILKLQLDINSLANSINITL